MFRQIVISLLVLVLLDPKGSCSLIDDLLAEIPKDATNMSIPLTPCENQLAQLIKAADMQQSWALKALDASPGDLSNFMMGQNHWLGNADTCRAVNSPVLLDYTDQQNELLRETAPFDFEYHVAYIEANSPWRLISKPTKQRMLHIGLCLPRICNIQQVEELLQNSLAHGETWQRFQMEPKLVYAKKPKLNQDFFQSGIWKIFLVIVGLNGILSIVPTMGFAEKNRVLQCFNVGTNWQRLFEEPKPDKENSMINGLRLFSAFALLAMHVIWFKYFSVDTSLAMSEKLVNMAMRHSYWMYAMEIFFAISGFLTVTNFLGNEKQLKSISQDNLIGNTLRFSRQVLHRYLRLMPLQLVIVVIATLVTTYLRQVSVFHINEPLDKICTKYWWRNALFIQNLYPLNELCTNWTWSLGCDMQFYVVSLLLLYIHTRHPKLIRSVSWILVILNLIYTWLPMQHIKNNFDSFFETNGWFYLSPWVRFFGYAVGCIYGYWYSYKNPMSPYHYVFRNVWSKLAMVSVFVTLAFKIYYKDLPSTNILLLAMMFVRLLLAAITGQIILTNYKPDWAKSWNWLLCLLRAGFVQKASRVTYAIYLLNPLVIISCYYLQSQSLAPDHSIIILLIAGHSVIVYLLAIIFTLLFEIPYNRLSNLMLSSSSKTKAS